MADTGTPPVLPIEFRRYNSYVEDPKWQRKFSTIWPAVAGLFVLLALPHLVRSIRSGRAFSSVWGVTEEFGHARYEAVGTSKSRAMRRGGRGSALRKVEAALSRIGAWLYWTLPGIGLNLGQIIIVAAYLLTVVLCIVLKAPLISNSNRAGFLALAQLTPIFLLATKNSILCLLLGPGRGYEKLNFLHRWAGRALFVSALVHGALWIRNHVQYGIEIMGEQKEQSGIAAFACLGIIVLSSLRVVRRWAWGLFFAVHVLVFPAFFITVCYHTIYARPWIYPALALYGLDLLLRMFKIRIKDAVLVPIGKQMTLVHIPYATSGWLAGQHVRLRVFFSGRVFEAHPLTIFAAPPSTTCISPSSYPQGVSLGARVSGDWTRALNVYAREAADEILADENSSKPIEAGELKKKHHANLRVEVPVQVMIDGPYGGSSVDLGQYDSVLLFAGGAGVTFTLGLLDDIVGRVARRRREGGERTRRIEFGWCARSTGLLLLFTTSPPSRRPRSLPHPSTVQESSFTSRSTSPVSVTPRLFHPSRTST
ncbi:hypothetical protein NLJ89_g11617 [Agrocybe chaxingu]|uniref:FAD-binding FR-type domain-containing protein n=1 Tax=Agrocybe chaxingu TaxID=84603 RepID=A0A9W8JLK2_9AGAR|nr:hypothetical protein NLJ89_g11617 [Agrocybe chaxingu]